MKVITGGITAPKGFQAAGIHAGIKRKRKDMALIYSEVPCNQAGVFTTNIVKAAPVKWDQEVTKEGTGVQAIVINSGVANACTGKEGYVCCEEMAAVTAGQLDINKQQVYVASTGVIGKQLPMDIIKDGIKTLAASLGSGIEDGGNAAEAIMTTDTRKKEVAIELSIGGKTVTVAGICKGSGMIHPNMATMLCFVTTDCNISKAMLQKALSTNVTDTFNMISVDGDTSTNDSVLVLANGLAGHEEITTENEAYQTFYEGLDYVMTELSKMIAGDGEGATCLFEVEVVGAADKEQARILSKSIVTSSLTKAAVFGNDANWGRILCAMGYSGAGFDPEKVDIFFSSKGGTIKIVENGTATDYSEAEATKILAQEEVRALVDLKLGTASATAWGCDLTLDYVKINADYRS